MATFPEWLQPDPTDIRRNCGLQPENVFPTRVEGLDDEERMLTLITQTIETQSMMVWGEARTAAGGRAFPSSAADLRKAFGLSLYGAPALEDRPQRYDWSRDAFVPIGALSEDDLAAIEAAKVAQADDIELRIEEQKTNARLVVEQLVYSKLWYSVDGDAAKERAKGYYITSRQLMKSLTDKLSQVSANINAQAAI